MKKTILKISVGFFTAILLLSGFYAFADDSTQTTLNPFLVISGYIKARSATNGLQIPSLSATTTDTTLHADATGKFYLGAGGSGGGSSTTINSLLGPAFTIVAGSNVTVATSAPNTITISASGGGSATTTISGVVGPNFTLQGTTNQVNVATSSGTITLSLPQDIATASSPQFAKIKTAVIFPASDSVQGVQINKADGTTNILNVDTTNGRVGIGTSTPAKLLHISGSQDTSALTPGATTVGIEISNTSGTALPGREGTILFSQSGGVNTSQYAAISGVITGSSEQTQIGSLLFSTKANVGDTSLTARMAITSAGNVGIGTTSPQDKLSVQGALGVRSGNNLNLYGTGDSTYSQFSMGAADLTLKNGNGNFIAQSAGNIKLQTYTGGTYNDKVTILYSGNVGIGTTSPASLLHIYGTSPFLNIDRSSGSNNSQVQFSQANVAKGYLGVAGAANGLVTGSASGDLVARSQGGNIIFTTDSGATANVYIKNGGNVGIATTTPNAKLHVYGSNAFKYTDIGLAATTYTIATSTDNIIYVSTTTAATTINLPACVGSVDQVIYTVKDKGGAAGTQNITVTATAAATIDGAATKIINTAYGSTKVQCVSGSGWFVLP